MHLEASCLETNRATIPTKQTFILCLCNQCLSPLTLWVQIPLRRGSLNTTLCDKVWQWLATCLWFSPGTPVSSTNKTDSHKITEILLKVALNTTNQTKPRILTINDITIIMPLFRVAYTYLIRWKFDFLHLSNWKKKLKLTCGKDLYGHIISLRGEV